MAFATKILLVMILPTIMALRLLSFCHERAKILRSILLVVESFLVSIVTLFYSDDRLTVDSEKLHVELGWPTNFVVQDQSRFDPPLPFDAKWQWESPTQIIGWDLAMNISIWVVVLGTLTWLVKISIQKRD